MFEHLPNVGYMEGEDYMGGDLLETKWKLLRGTGRALSIKEKLNEL